MQEELKMINKNGTWQLVERPSNQKEIEVKGLYKTKLKSDGSICKHKAKLPAKAYKKKQIFYNRPKHTNIRFLNTQESIIEKRVVIEYYHIEEKGADILQSHLKLSYLPDEENRYLFPKCQGGVLSMVIVNKSKLPPPMHALQHSKLSCNRWKVHELMSSHLLSQILNQLAVTKLLPPL